MGNRACFLTALLCLFSPLARADNVGFSRLAAADPPGAMPEVGVWYPTDVAPTKQDLELFTQTVARTRP